LRSDYRDDNERVVRRWNEVLEENEITTFRFKVPSTRFHRSVGVYAGHPFAPDGQPLSAAEWEARKAEFLISDADLAYLRSIMTASVTEAGKFASYIAPPRVGIKGRPVDFEYVRL
jgi:benzoyl-CoA 2,3-dioxygenase component B